MKNKRLSGAFGMLSQELDNPEPPKPESKPAPEKKPEVREAGTNKPVSKTPSKKPRAKKTDEGDGKLISIDPALVTSWRYKDRQSEDLQGEDFEQLMTSIAHRGQDTPIIVRPRKSGKFQYEEVAGFRRLNACRALGMNVQAIVREMDDQTAYAVQIDENDVRTSPGYWRRGESLLQVSEAGVYPTQEAMSIAIGIGRSTISNYIRVVRSMPEVFQRRVQLNKFGRDVLFYLVSLNDQPEELLEQWLLSDYGSWRWAIKQVGPKEIEKSFKQFLNNTELKEKEAPVKKDGAKTYIGKAGKLFSITRKGESVLINILKDGKRIMSEEEIAEALQKIMDEKAES